MPSDVFEIDAAPGLDAPKRASYFRASSLYALRPSFFFFFFELLSLLPERSLPPFELRVLPLIVARSRYFGYPSSL